MDHQENENIILFDTLYTTNHTQILKILLPFLEEDLQKRIAIMIKYMEFQYTMSYANTNTIKVCDSSSRKKEFDAEKFFQSIRGYCSEEEKAMFQKLMGFKSTMAMYQQMTEMMKLMKDMAPPQGESGSKGTSSGDGGGFGFGGGNAFDMLKGMLTPEQQAMFEMFQSDM